MTSNWTNWLHQLTSDLLLLNVLTQHSDRSAPDFSLFLSWGQRSNAAVDPWTALLPKAQSPAGVTDTPCCACVCVWEVSYLSMQMSVFGGLAQGVVQSFWKTRNRQLTWKQTYTQTEIKTHANSQPANGVHLHWKTEHTHSHTQGHVLGASKWV